MDHQKWEALEWPDRSKYDGQVLEKKCHGLGVMEHPNGDRYKGEFRNGAMDGVGAYVWKGETVYRGEWHENQMEGCGVRISRQADGEFLVQEGQFVGDHFLGTFMDCGLAEARQAATEADMAASQAGLFKVPQELNKQAEHALRPKGRQSQNKTNSAEKSSWVQGFLKTFSNKEET